MEIEGRVKEGREWEERRKEGRVGKGEGVGKEEGRRGRKSNSEMKIVRGNKKGA